jgi:MFS family permease
MVSSFILGYLLSRYNRKNILQVGMMGLAIMDVFIGIGFVKYI